jgi:hypothetical protein
MASLRDYFEEYEDYDGQVWYGFSKGDRVYGGIHVNLEKCLVKYRFSDGSNIYERQELYTTVACAIKAANDYGAQVRKSNGVPYPDSLMPNGEKL